MDLSKATIEITRGPPATELTYRRRTLELGALGSDEIKVNSLRPAVDDNDDRSTMIFCYDIQQGECVTQSDFPAWLTPYSDKSLTYVYATFNPGLNPFFDFRELE